MIVHKTMPCIKMLDFVKVKSGVNRIDVHEKDVEITYTANNADSGNDKRSKNRQTRNVIKSQAFVSVTLAARALSHGASFMCALCSMHRRRYKTENHVRTQTYEKGNNNGGLNDTRNNKCLRQRQQTSTINSNEITRKTKKKQWNKTKHNKRSTTKGNRVWVEWLCAYRFL